MRTRTYILLSGFVTLALLGFITLAQQAQAQDGGANPTPVIITLTPTVSATPDLVTPTPTPEGLLGPDRFEPNDDVSSAVTLGFGLISGLTLVGDDRDVFTGFLKAGQRLRLDTTVFLGLDTRLELIWQGQLAAENDDRTTADVGSSLTFTAPTDGWYVLVVEKATVYDGMYDLATVLEEAPVPPTPSPTPTATPSPTPVIQPDLAEPNNWPETARPITPGQRATYTVGAGDVDFFTFLAKASSRYTCETVTDQVDTLLTVTGSAGTLGENDDRSFGRVDSSLTWTQVAEAQVVIKVAARGGSFGQYELICQPTSPPSPVAPAANHAPGGAALPTQTPTLAAAQFVSLTVQYLGRVQPQSIVKPTTIRLLVYYDANNDRQPGPGEGIANVSALAVDSRGQQLVQVFTNAQGEALFNLTNEAVARVIVPYVPGWSARVRVGEVNNEIVLGLPAVRLPIFIPVQNQPDSES